jgi:peptidoglycan/xylan/chitin deacetylase (PgdA/CDA1 family)
MHFLMTNDVASFSIPLNRYDAETAEKVYEVGLPRLLDLYAKHDIKCTFYFNECLEFKGKAVPTRRSANFF